MPNQQKYQGYIVLDIETTGFDPNIDDCIEFAAIRLDSSGKEVERLDLLLATKKEVSPLVQSLTGITPDMIANSPHLDEVKPRIEEFVGDLPIVGHNINFDIDFLVAKGINLPGDPLDTLELAQTILPAQPGYGLEQLSHRMGFSNQPSHRAMNDVLATADLFLALTEKISNFKPDTNKQIGELLKLQEWMWGWLWESDFANFQKVTHQEEQPSEYTDYLVSQITHNQTLVSELEKSATGKINLLESHLPCDSFAQAMLLAGAQAPSLVVVPSGLLRQVKWDRLATTLNTRIDIANELSQLSGTGNPLQVVAGVEERTNSLIKLAIKLTLWEQEWGKLATQLFLTSDERYEWEQKFVESTANTTYDLTPEGIWLITADQLEKVSNLSEFTLESAHPHNLEETFFDTQIRTFSIPYFNAAISSRRDFIHREVVPTHHKDADELFKLLSQIAPKLNQIGEIMIQIFTDNPPTNVFERDIELTRALSPVELEKNISEVVRFFELYIAKLASLGFDDTNQHIIRTKKLVEHLVALQQFDAHFKYFLFAEPTKFYLQIIPDFTAFTHIHDLFAAAKQVNIVSAGLVYKQGFEYWKNLFENATGKMLINHQQTHTILQPRDINTDDNLQDLMQFAKHLIAGNKRVLLVAGSAYDARMLFDELHGRMPEQAAQISSLDTIGHSDKLDATLPEGHGHLLVVPMFWLERAAPSLDVVDVVIINKVPFEPSAKPIAKLYRGDSTSFGAYTLPKTTLRLKENLHYLAGKQMPIIFFDPRLFTKDYGNDIVGSLTGWNVTEISFSDLQKTV